MPKSLWLMAESEPEKRAWAEAVEVALVRGLSVLLPAVLRVPSFVHHLRVCFHIIGNAHA